MTQSIETTSKLGLPSPKERRRLREAAGLTQDDVAAAIGVTPSTVRSWETGRTAPRGRKREAYLKLLTAAAGGGTRAVPEPPPPPPEPAPEPPPAPAPADPPATGAAGDPVHNAPADGAARLPAKPPPPEAATAVTAAAADPAPPGPSAPQPPPEPAPEPAPDPADAADPGPAAEAEPDPGPPPAPVPLGPVEAFDALYAYAAPALVRQTYLLTGRRGLARISVERAFHQAWRCWPEVATDPDPVGWVRAAAYEYALSPWHRLSRAHKHPDKPPAEPADRILMDAMLALPPAHRRTVLLYDGIGLDLPDTAAETEATTPTAGKRLVNAHAELANRLPELVDVPPEKQSALLRERLGSLTPAVSLEPRPAADVRRTCEHRNRFWTRAVVGLTAAITAATAYTVVTAPTKYEPLPAPGAVVAGVPAPHNGPPRLSDESRQLHEKLRSEPAAGPHRLHPRGE
ncbi:helix-turn-helix domain-containing protein [Streptomyces sp. NPDC006529]|uniref:helix-turn-helix domain-containing protein n=1 Tax=Streptomyces sp. NPDC006529 TaxID=3157177 RepID=UPI0033A8AD48